FSPVEFSALIDRVFAFDSRERLPRLMFSPLNAAIVSLVGPQLSPPCAGPGWRSLARRRRASTPFRSLFALPRRMPSAGRRAGLLAPTGLPAGVFRPRGGQTGSQRIEKSLCPKVLFIPCSALFPVLFRVLFVDLLLLESGHVRARAQNEA